MISHGTVFLPILHPDNNLQSWFSIAAFLSPLSASGLCILFPTWGTGSVDI